MPPSAPPAHNLDALLIGNGEFSLSLGASTPAQAAVLGFRDFGNIKAFQIDSGGDDKEHFGSYRGILRRDDLRKQKLKLSYKITCDEWTPNALKFLFYGLTGNPYTRSAIAAVAGTQIAFSNGAPSNPLLWYDILDSTGARVRDLVAVTFTTKTEGTDFQLDYKLGRVQFLTAQTANVTPTITAAAVAVGGATSMATMTPLSQNLFEGIGRLVVFDEDDKQQVVLEHADFGCQVEITGSADVKADDYSDLALMVSISNPLGTVFVRQ